MTPCWNLSAGMTNRASDSDDNLFLRRIRLTETCRRKREPAHVDGGVVMWLSPDVELFLSCARTHVDSETATRIRATVMRDIDWPHLIAAVGSHGTMPLFYSCLKATCLEGLPSGVLDGLRGAFDANARHSRLLTEELVRLAKLFELHGIRAIPFKGPVLAASVYGNCALRQFVDLDFLVDKAVVLGARDLLISSGYRPRRRRNDAQEAAFLRAESEYPFVRRDGRVSLDLHWRVTPRRFFSRFSFERLWNRAAPVSLNGTIVRNLAPEDLIMILSVHGAKHMWQRLQWICDVAELLRAHPQIDWAGLMGRAGELGCKRMVCLGLLLASDLLDAPVPTGIAQRLYATSEVAALATKVSKGLFAQFCGWSGALERFRFHLAARERVRDKARCIVFFIHSAITPTYGDWELFPLPSCLFFVYYILRPFRVLAKYGRRGLKPPGKAGLTRRPIGGPPKVGQSPIH